jgi:transposase-like protein
MQCPKCESTEKRKAGFVKGLQRWRCKACGCQYTRSVPKGRSQQEKLTALAMYMNGSSLRSIAKHLKASTPSVLSWIRSFKALAEKRPEVGSATVVELDELCTFLTQKNAKYGYGWLFVEKQGGCWTGKWVVGELKR